MAALFQLDSPVLYFGPRLPKGVRFTQRRFVLWPALMYRVVAPEVRDREINVLQKAVLGLCRAGITVPQRIGDRLKIHRDLATLIIAELLQRGLIRADGLPSQAGEELFQAETLDMRPPVTGHVFQDPWSGDLWPRFVKRLDFAELERGESGFPDLMLGTRGKPRRERAFMCRPGADAVPPAPDVRQILRATRRYKAALRNSELVEVDDDDATVDVDVGPALERVSMVDDSPVPVFLATFVYLVEGEMSADWHACDPFGLGENTMLRRAIARELPNQSGLREVLEGLLGDSLDSRAAEQQKWISEVRALAVANVERRLTVNARDLPEFDALVELEMGCVEAEYLGDRCPEQRLRDLLGAARRVLESVFRTIAGRFPPGTVWRQVYLSDKSGKSRPVQDMAYVERVYEEHAKRLGFRIPLPAAISRTRPNHLKAACYESGWRLRGAIVASMMAASSQPEHPLAVVAARHPDLIGELDRIASLAGDAIHAGGRALDFTSVSEVVESVYRAVAVLGGLDQGQA